MLKFSTHMNVLPTFEFVNSAIKLVPYKAFFMSKSN